MSKGDGGKAGLPMALILTAIVFTWVGFAIAGACGGP